MVKQTHVAFAHWCLANSLPFNVGECPLFKRFVRCAQNVGSDYSPPLKDEVSGKLLNATYESYFEEEMSKVLEDVDLFGITIYGDGATMKTTPYINVLACSPGEFILFVSSAHLHCHLLLVMFAI